MSLVYNILYRHERKTDLRNGRLSRMTAISATFAPIPNAPREMRIVAAVWSVG